MQEIQVESWDEFEAGLSRYARLPATRRNQFIFRGHADASWTLRPTLDRPGLRPDGSIRESMLRRMVEEFKRNAYGLPFGLGVPESPNAWELLGRHHGLPTTILDWTTSPYVAAFFAYEEPSDADRVAIFVFSRDYFVRDAPGPDCVEIWDEIDDFRYNPRAIEQGSVFMKVTDANPALEEDLAGYLWKYALPASERPAVLARLAEMRINGRNLFRDLDHAAKTAAWTVVDGG